MPVVIRPRRSVLYMPGSNPRALEKGRSLAADALILDLEDSVAVDRKEEARDAIVATLAQGGYGGRELLVRVNGLDSRWGRDDLTAIARTGAHGIVMTKVESADIVRKTAHILDEGGAPETLAIWCMIETPMGVLRAEEIAAADPRMAGLIMGTADLAMELNCQNTITREAFLYSLSKCVLAARAHGLSILDGVHEDLEDDEGFATSCQQGSDLGFDGKTLIHPKTIAMANEVFGPNLDELDEARAKINAFEKAQANGQGVTTLNGKLVEHLHVKRARRLIQLAEMIEQLQG